MKISFAITSAALLFCGVNAETFLFPIPQEVSWTGHGAVLSQEFKITGARNHHVKDAASRYEKLVKKEKWTPVQVPYEKQAALKMTNALRQLKINVKNNNVKLDMGVDESYNLEVPSNGGSATLTAPTWVGALRGLETFSQLVIGSDDGSVVHTATINDSPSYGHRGISLDTSRNFYPVADLLRTIDALAYNKMNVFHWHATDSQSWPLEFKSHPELSAKGAYSRKETYSLKDVQKVIKYGEARGVRVYLEIDMPAHTASIGETYPDIMTCMNEFWGPLAAEPPAGQLSPISDKGLALVKDLIKEATDTFPDTLYHTGGDEINGKCWEQDKVVGEYLKKHNLSTDELWVEWTNKVFDYVKQHTKKRPVSWEDPVNAAKSTGGKFPKDVIVQTWNNPAANYTSQGHDVIISSSDYFYLDCGNGGWIGDDDRYISPTQAQTTDDTFNYGGIGGSWCSPYKTWQRIYTFDPTHGITKDQPGKVLGVELALWSEQSGPTVLDMKLWPRSAAGAEVFWSGPYDKKNNRRTLAEVQPRFNDWVYRLQDRGIAAVPIQPKYCAKHPHACDLNEPKK
ncbi:glycoside hydrolase superfamily [Absidia repens]|uniref:Beta-hexosaminidase n=1 Tax=Absidia repens TaxID=90262 RepID=A0A1X2IJQ5_9FUNG|nr:glycoside hydrolase superfamily [Absidia repens]